uniref:Uncharacterized protein n=1 Tax=Brassica campestris TaxID=3711 RepID=M4F2P3_BRACM
MNPGTKNKQSSSSVRRTDPIRLGRWPSWIEHKTSSAIRRDGPVQFGGWPSWIELATSSTIRRAGPVHFGGWPSWNDCAVLVSSAKLLPPNLIKLALASLRSGAPLELYDFKTARTRFLVSSSDVSYVTATNN